MKNEFLHDLVRYIGLTFLFSLAGCNYSPEDGFDKIIQLGKDSPEAAIEELRYFIYHNPGHFDSHIAIADLLMTNSENDSRRIYVARHYLSMAASLDVPAQMKSSAMQRYVGAKLRQDVNPENIEHLVTLAEALFDNDQFLDAADVYLRAAWVGFSQDNFREAERMSEEASKSLKKIDYGELDARQKGQAEQLQQTVGLSVVSLKQVRRQFVGSLSDQPQWPETAIGGEQFPAPDVAFLRASSNFVEHLEKSKKIRRRIERAIQRLSEEESSSAAGDMQQALDKVLQADEGNDHADNPRRDMITARVWANLADVIGPSGEQTLRTTALERAIFYFDRAGEMDKAQALRQ